MPKVEIRLEGHYMTEIKHHEAPIVQILGQMDTFRTFCECPQFITLRMHILGYYVALHKDTTRNLLQIRYGLRNTKMD